MAAGLAIADLALPEAILKVVNDREKLDTWEYSLETNTEHQTIVGAIKSLESLGDVVKTEPRQFTTWAPTEEGQAVMEHGSHEVRVFEAVDPKNGTPQSSLMKSVPNAKIGFSKAMSSGWLRLEKNEGGEPRVYRKVDRVVDNVANILKSISGGKEVEGGDLKELKKRKLVTNVTTKAFVVTKGERFTTTIEKPDTELTPEMIQSGNWKTKTFKPYNFKAKGVPLPCGHLHPLMKVRSEYREIFLQMGFTEMPTNNYVESSFWNFDALFQPQQHPARDAHDTFFIEDPEKSHVFPEDYLQRVKEVHETGGYGSQGYKYSWKREEAQKNIMRTHTTAVSARMLYSIAQNGFKPAKLFSVDRVFRNETLDATHLAEFHQIEGVVADRNISLGHLIGILYEFFSKLGIEKLRFKPAYNPYTEPSMEIFSYHEG
jgi:phenylalanyl-tRNA synthetase alpha chain